MITRIPKKESTPTVIIPLKYLLLGASVVGSFTCILAICIAIGLGKKKFWPLLQVSQYAATYPAVYFFRFGLNMSGFFLLIVGVQLCRQANILHLPKILKPPKLIGIACMCCGLGLCGLSTVSCNENSDVHLSFAFIFFASALALQVINFIRMIRDKYTQLLGFKYCALCLFCYLAALVLMGLVAYDFVPLKKYWISIGEFISVFEILAFVMWYAENFQNYELYSVQPLDHRFERQSEKDIL